jgi:hypothetical protein
VVSAGIRCGDLFRICHIARVEAAGRFGTESLDAAMTYGERTFLSKAGETQPDA